MAKQVTRKTVGCSETLRTSTTRAGVTKSRSKPMPTEEQIRARAYEIYLRRNNGPGDALSDWIQAERELAEEMSR